jgi:hypothetical protein
VNVLLVSALSDLKAIDSEVEGIVNSGLKVQMLRNATVARLADFAMKGIDVVWFATHGVEADPIHGLPEPGVMLADGVLPASSIGQLVRANDIKRVVLNTCDSVGVALAIVDHTQADIICTVVPVGDNTASLTGRTFAERLAKHGDFRRAYEEAKPAGNSAYLYLTAYRKDGPQNGNGGGDIPALLERWGQALQAEIRQLDQRLSQVENGLRGRINTMDNQVAVRLLELENQIDTSYHPRLTRTQGLRWLGGYLLCGLAVIITPSLWAVRLERAEAYVVGGVLYSMAALLFVRGLGFNWKQRGDHADHR